MPDSNKDIQAAKTFLQECHYWQLVSLRPVASDDAVHITAIKELARRDKALQTIKRSNELIGQILEYRFIRRYYVQKTLDLLAKAGHQMTSRTLRRKQRQGLLMVYSLMQAM